MCSIRSRPWFRARSSSRAERPSDLSGTMAANGSRPWSHPISFAARSKRRWPMACWRMRTKPTTRMPPRCRTRVAPWCRLRSLAERHGISGAHFFACGGAWLRRRPAGDHVPGHSSLVANGTKAATASPACSVRRLRQAARPVSISNRCGGSSTTPRSDPPASPRGSAIRSYREGFRFGGMLGAAA